MNSIQFTNDIKELKFKKFKKFLKDFAVAIWTLTSREMRWNRRKKCATATGAIDSSWLRNVSVFTNLKSFRFMVILVNAS